MTMALDANQQRFAPSPFDHMSSSSSSSSSSTSSSPYSNHAHFTNPWSSASSTGQTLYGSSHDASTLPHLNLAGRPAQPGPRTSTGASMTYGVPASNAGSPHGHSSMAGVYGQADLGLGGRMPLPTTSSSTYDGVNGTYATSSAYDQLAYAQTAPIRSSPAYGLHHDAGARRYSQQSAGSSVSSLSGASIHSLPHLAQDDRRSFQDALEASHGMLSMSQETPRNIYDVRNNQRVAAAAVAASARPASDGYGFPPTHSSSSSISSSAGYYYGAANSPHNGGGSADGSASDYSTAGSDMESLSGRARSLGMLDSHPPAPPQSMMGSFNSKATTSTQKKHKCKVCDKRFTRPSSLQTHMYSHTGEKPFCCEFEGCGRHFSVVSNLRRHKKVHRGQSEGPSEGQAETPSDAGSEEVKSD